MRYDFKCENCKVVFEVNESMKDTKPTKECIECGGHAVKVIEPATIVFNGGGWSPKFHR